MFFSFVGGAQQNKPKRKLQAKASVLQSGSDQLKDAKVSRFAIQAFHGHISLVFMVHKYILGCCPRVDSLPNMYSFWLFWLLAWNIGAN